MIFIASVVFALPKPSHAATLHRSLPARGEIQLFKAPDESSTVVTILKPGDELSPLAETLVGEGVRWYLVKATNDRVGWIKQGDTEQSKQLETFFK
ncbi:MAG TPA: SH3 domain-containing protein, partial [Terriglobales bacterium]|nr:SH3 domain-containing protein [Terriglobales bacterium]